MNMLNIVLLAIFGISSVLLVIIILLQDEQSDGLGGLFGGGASNQVGNRKGNILTKTTTVLGIIFIVIAFSTAWINHNASNTSGIEKAALAKQNKTAGLEWYKTSPDQTAPAASVAPLASAAPVESAVPAASVAPTPSKN